MKAFYLEDNTNLDIDNSNEISIMTASLDWPISISSHLLKSFIDSNISTYQKRAKNYLDILYKYFHKKELPHNIERHINNKKQKLLKIHLKLKENQYFRIIFAYQGNWIEKYVDFKDWNQLDEKLLDIKIKIDKAIAQNSQSLNSILNYGGSLFRHFLDKYSLLSNSLIDNCQSVEIYFSDFDVFFPIEWILPSVFVIRLLPQKVKKIIDYQNDFIFIYSNKLNNASNEIQNSLNFQYNLQIFSENFIPENLHLNPAVNLIHIAAHAIFDKQSSIEINRVLRQDLRFLPDAKLIVLNCCEIGYKPRGIIESSIESQCEFIISSPYTINDNEAENFYEFYKILDMNSIYESYKAYSLIKNNFSTQYQIWTNY